MLSYKIGGAFLISILLLSCRPSDLKEYDKPYFDFDSLVNSQIKFVSSKKAAISKISQLDNKQDTSRFALDSARLAHEWDVFQQLDVINKPMYRGHYEITEGQDTKSNLRVRSYVAKVKSYNTIKFPIPFVRFYFHENFKKLIRIESKYIEQNALYFTSRNLVLEFDEHSGIPLIQHYLIKGSQKMILSDSVKFSIKGIIE